MGLNLLLFVVALLSTSASHLENHYESIVVRWLERSRQIDHHGISSPELAKKIIAQKGWTCYATLIHLQLHLKEKEKRPESEPLRTVIVPRSEIDEIMKMCGCERARATMYCPLQASNALKAMNTTVGIVGSEINWVFNRQHNGLGNQLFEVAFSRLLAESTGRLWATSLIEPSRGESPWRKAEYPPNSVNGWKLFRRIFQTEEQCARAAVALRDDPNATRFCLDDGTRCALSDRPYDQHLRKQNTLSQLIAALYSEPCAHRCLFTVGYFQEPLLLAPVKERVRFYLLGGRTLIPPAHPYPKLSTSDVVVHVRCCTHRGGGCDWLFLPFEYYDSILSRLTARASGAARVFVVSPCAPDTEIMQHFTQKYQSVAVTPPRRGRTPEEMVEDMASDFRFLSSATTLVLGKSTFGFMAAWLSEAAAEIHMPVEGRRHALERIPMDPTDGRFVYHNPGTDEWFGQVQGGDSALRFEERGRWFGPKQFDRLGNFLPPKRQGDKGGESEGQS